MAPFWRDAWWWGRLLATNYEGYHLVFPPPNITAPPRTEPVAKQKGAVAHWAWSHLTLVYDRAFLGQPNGPTINRGNDFWNFLSFNKKNACLVLGKMVLAPVERQGVGSGRSGHRAGSGVVGHTYARANQWRSLPMLLRLRRRNANKRRHHLSVKCYL